MGNVYASSQKSTSDGFRTLSPEDPSLIFSENSEEKLENPGSLEELHKKCKGMSCIYNNMC